MKYHIKIYLKCISLKTGFPKFFLQYVPRLPINDIEKFEN